MIVKTHSKDGKILVAVIDSELAGQVIEEGNTQLDLRSDFYKGQEATRDEAGDLMRNADMVNLVGEEAIKLGVQEGVVDQQHVKRVKGIPFAQGLTIKD